MLFGFGTSILGAMLADAHYPFVALFAGLNTRSNVAFELQRRLNPEPSQLVSGLQASYLLRFHGTNTILKFDAIPKLHIPLLHTTTIP